MRSLCRALLVLNVLYCLLAAAQEGLPGWHMFESVEPTAHTLHDRDGALVDVHAFLPKGANLVDRRELREVVAFVCRRAPDRAPFTYSEAAWNGKVVVLEPQASPSGCKIHAPR